MKTKVTDVAQMLDDLNLPVAAARLRKIQSGPELTNFSSVQLLREVIEPQYIESMNTRFTTNLRQSSLINKSAKAENLKTVNIPLRLSRLAGYYGPAGRFRWPYAEFQTVKIIQ